MSDELAEYEGPIQRPTFLTVLCILTFIGSAWGLINESIKYINADSQAKAISIVKEKAETDIKRNKDTTNPGFQITQKMVSGLNISPANIKKGAIYSGIAAILCLAGAFMMWSLKRKGFYVYVAGTLTGVISPFLIFGTDNFLAIISSVMIGFVGMIFMILYGVNLKYMK